MKRNTMRLKAIINNIAKENNVAAQIEIIISIRLYKSVLKGLEIKNEDYFTIYRNLKTN